RNIIMSQILHELKIQPENKKLLMPADTTLLEAITEAGISITAACGGKASCGKCRIIIEDGNLPLPTDAELSILTEEQLRSGMRLACRTKLNGDMVITIPDTSRSLEIQILMGGASHPVELSPNVSKYYVELPTQTLTEAVSLFDHLCRRLNLRADASLRSGQALRADLALLQRLPNVLRAWNNKLTAVVCADKLIALEQGDTTRRCYGIALDVGTTTIVGALIDLTTGEDVATTSMVNPQSQYGHDVISRINFAIEGEHGLDELQLSVIGAINQLIASLIKSSKVKSDEIYEMTVVGNSTMFHLLLGINPRSLGTMPYVPAVSHSVDVNAAELGILQVNPAADVHVLPNIAGFIGADSVGAILAANFDKAEDDSIKIMADMGTNCEIILRKDDQLLACSAAAGPAFEGAKIKNGMYAAPGAIESVSLNDDCEYKTIGGSEPKGICGSGLVDLGAELLRVGIVDATGRMLAPDELNDKISPHLRKRIVKNETDEILEFVIANSGNNEPITLTQRDVRELQLAKAAIRTGIEVLLRQAELQLDDVDELYVAGGFGNYINKENAIRLGLIPAMPLERIKFIGNAAFIGAKMSLISRDIRGRADKVARSVQHLQIADTPDFQTLYMESMMF
ncbi:MAG: ASKHA domain-containing protein, partial [Candidatus Poribacteria bacterium]